MLALQEQINMILYLNLKSADLGNTLAKLTIFSTLWYIDWNAAFSAIAKTYCFRNRGGWVLRSRPVRARTISEVGLDWTN